MNTHRSTRRLTASTHAVRGSAALEVLMLMVFIILPIFVLLFNMGYNGMRQRESQNALRLGAFLFVDGLTTGDATAARNSAQTNVNGALFPKEQNALTLSVTGQKNAPANLPKVDGLFSQASFRQAVQAKVTRSPPYDVFASTPIERSIIVAANTFTYCEAQDKLFKNSDSAALNALSFLGKTGLWPFGWEPPNKSVCP